MYEKEIRIAWDEPKRQANIEKHGLEFGSVTLDVLVNARLVRPARHGRLGIISKLASGKVVAMIVQPLGSEAVSIVSLRPASEKERSCHGWSSPIHGR
jgi:uncharacterized DUF497 family protein